MNDSPARPGSPSRRDFIKLAGLAAAAGVVAPSRAFSQAPAVVHRPPGARAKNIVFMVSDGMSISTLSMADQLRLLMENRSSNWMRMYRELPVARSLMDTSSFDNLVTDSAAAASAWGCGQKIPNGRINVDHQGREHEPILRIARRNGLRTGLVTTATVTHATPAGFAANALKRNDQETIALQYLDRGYEVILGGGRRIFAPEHRADGRDLSAEFQAGGHTFVSDREGLLKARPQNGNLLGLFAPVYLPYEIDRLHDEAAKAAVPSLAEMTSAALELLSGDGPGFLVQIEAARVDHAAHGNDISGLLYDQLAFDDAIAVALEFCLRNPDTLLLVTTDHGNANPGLNAGGEGGRATLGQVRRFTGSLSSMNQRWGEPHLQDPAAVRAHIHATTGIEIRDQHAGMIMARLREEGTTPYRRMSGVTGVVGQVLAEYLDIGWAGNSHTSDHVELAALGPGSERLKPFTVNTDLFAFMTESLGLGI